MNWLTMLALAGTIVGAASAGAQGTPLGTPKTDSPSAKAATPAAGAPAAPNTIAVYPFGSALNGVQPIQTALAARSRMAFQANGAWTVLDRSGEPQLQAEIDKIHSAADFNSTVRIRDDRQLNARYLLMGYLEQGRVDPTATPNGPIYNVQLDLDVRMIDVETGRSDDKVFHVNSALLSKDASKEAFGRYFKNAMAGQAPKTGALVAWNPDEALTRAYRNAYDATLKWANEMAAAHGVGGGTSVGAKP